MEVKIKVISVTDYERDSVKIAGLASHEDDAEIYALLAKEIASKEENGEWPGLPFTTILEVEDPDDNILKRYDFDLEVWLAAEHIDEIVDAYENACCEFDLIKPLDVEFEVITDEK